MTIKYLYDNKIDYNQHLTVFEFSFPLLGLHRYRRACLSLRRQPLWHCRGRKKKGVVETLDVEAGPAEISLSPPYSDLAARCELSVQLPSYLCPNNQTKHQTPHVQLKHRLQEKTRKLREQERQDTPILRAPLKPTQHRESRGKQQNVLKLSWEDVKTSIERTTEIAKFFR